MNDVIEPPMRLDSFLEVLHGITAWALRADRSSRCGRTNYNRSFDAAFVAADPDARRARGPHSLAAVGLRRRLDMIRHTPRRSNLAHQRLAFTR
jgi:hypothetical protein